MYYNDSLHNHVSRMAISLNPGLKGQLEYKSATIGGAKLMHHNIRWLLEQENIGIKKPFEVVIIQGASDEALGATPDKNYVNTVQAYSDLIRDHGAQPYLYMTPAYVKPHKLYKKELISEIRHNVMQAAKRANIPVIPVGLAFAEAYRRNPEIKLHKHFDGSHPTLKGTYLAACVVYLTIYGGSLESSDYDYFGTIDKETALFLRQVAADVTEAFTNEG